MEVALWFGGVLTEKLGISLLFQCKKGFIGDPLFFTVLDITYFQTLVKFFMLKVFSSYCPYLYSYELIRKINILSYSIENLSASTNI